MMKYLFVLLLATCAFAEDEIVSEDLEIDPESAQFMQMQQFAPMGMGMGMNFGQRRYSSSCMNSCPCLQRCTVWWWIPCPCFCPPPCDDNGGDQNTPPEETTTTTTPTTTTTTTTKTTTTTTPTTTTTTSSCCICRPIQPCTIWWLCQPRCQPSCCQPPTPPPCNPCSCQPCLPWTPCSPCNCTNPCSNNNNNNNNNRQKEKEEEKQEPEYEDQRFPRIEDLRERLRNGLDLILERRQPEQQW